MPDVEFVSRGGMKLNHALRHFGVDPGGMVCADLGSHVGGFVDCLLQRGAGMVYAVDTCYGTLAWKLRKDSRVVVLERTNALHVDLPEKVDLVTIDVGWTRQELILPHAAHLLKPQGRIITLLKPHYEAPRNLLTHGVLPECHWPTIVDRVLAEITALGLCIEAWTISPLLGHGGNREVFALLSERKNRLQEPAGQPTP